VKLGKISLADRVIGEGCPSFIIAEMGLGHDGSLGAAHAFIDAVAAAGADAVKFQTHIADAEGTREENFRVNVFPQDATRADYWRRTAFTEEQWCELKQHADAAGVLFLSSPFSLEAVRLLERVGVPAWKIASGETNNTPLLRDIAATGLPVLMSTGMSTLAEVDAAVEVVRACGADLVLYQCVNRYPCPPEHLGLNMIATYRERYGLSVGFSDHSGRTVTALAARLQGACSVEVHVTFSRDCFGPDAAASLTVSEFGAMVRDMRYLEIALGTPTDKDEEAASLQEVRALFTKSVVAARDLAAGLPLCMADFDFKKPGTGIPSAAVNTLLGRRLRQPILRNHQLRWEDLHEEA
jgi:N-acetylneuraminate synthase